MEYLLNSHWWGAALVFAALAISIPIGFRREIKFKRTFGVWPGALGVECAVWAVLRAKADSVKEADNSRRGLRIGENRRNEANEKYDTELDALKGLFALAERFNFKEQVLEATEDLCRETDVNI